MSERHNGIIELNESSFSSEVLDAEEPVLVGFLAGWSESSRMIAPLLESVAHERAGEVKVTAVNFDEHEGLARHYGVRAVPTLLIFNRGSVWHQIAGCITSRELHSMLDLFA